jgi:hypothetical protein
VLVACCGFPIGFGACITLAGRALLAVVLSNAGRYMLTLSLLILGTPGLFV